MSQLFKKAFVVSAVTIIAFAIGFLFSASTFFSDMNELIIIKLSSALQNTILAHYNKLMIYPDAHHYFLLPQGTYAAGYPQIATIGMPVLILLNAFMNSLLQPLFLCVFTPQTILIICFLPFFLYGTGAYFRKVPVMILFFFIFSIYIGLKDCVVEPLIRHRIACELIYYLISVAGLARLISGRSS